jgi:hypothetical protein
MNNSNDERKEEKENPEETEVRENEESVETETEDREAIEAKEKEKEKEEKEKIEEEEARTEAKKKEEEAKEKEAKEKEAKEKEVKDLEKELEAKEKEKEWNELVKKVDGNLLQNKEFEMKKAHAWHLYHEMKSPSLSYRGEPVLSYNKATNLSGKKYKYLTVGEYISVNNSTTPFTLLAICYVKVGNRYRLDAFYADDSFESLKFVELNHVTGAFPQLILSFLNSYF